MQNIFSRLPVIEDFIVFLIFIAVTITFFLLTYLFLRPYSQEPQTFGVRVFLLSSIIGLTCALIILMSANSADFSKIYNVKFVEKESISELQYSKKDEFKQSLLNKLYTDNGNIYIIKGPKNDQYIVSTNKKILEDVLAGKDHSSHPDYQIVSKEDVKKALENKALENKVSEDKPQETAPSNVKENDFK